MALETRVVETTHHTTETPRFQQIPCTSRCRSRANSRTIIAVELAGAKYLSQPPKCPSCRCQRCVPDYERHIHHPARSHANPAQQKGKEIPSRDVNIIPRIVRHRIVGEAPSVHLAEGKRDDVLEAQRDHERRMAERVHLVDFQRQPEGEGSHLNRTTDYD